MRYIIYDSLSLLSLSLFCDRVVAQPTRLLFHIAMPSVELFTRQMLQLNNKAHSRKGQTKSLDSAQPLSIVILIRQQQQQTSIASPVRMAIERTPRPPNDRRLSNFKLIAPFKTLTSSFSFLLNDVTHPGRPTPRNLWFLPPAYLAFAKHSDSRPAAWRWNSKSKSRQGKKKMKFKNEALQLGIQKKGPSVISWKEHRLSWNIHRQGWFARLFVWPIVDCMCATGSLSKPMPPSFLASLAYLFIYFWCFERMNERTNERTRRKKREAPISW